jgi:lipoyl(octanoyl) transferase
VGTETSAKLDVRWLGRVDYEEAWSLQRELAVDRARGTVPDTLLLLEHEPVYTTGHRDVDSNLRVAREVLGAPLILSDRGGDITFHGPGQVVAYPIVDLKAAGLGVVGYVRGLEQIVVDTVAEYGIEAGTICGSTGVWVEDEKIAAIGVRVGRPLAGAGPWVTTHGVALNVSVDLSWFERIVPCGIRDRGVTSMTRLTGETLTVREVAETLAGRFRNDFVRDLVTDEW